MKNFGQPSDEAIKLTLMYFKHTSLPRILAKRKQKEESQLKSKEDVRV